LLAVVLALAGLVALAAAGVLVGNGYQPLAARGGTDASGSGSTVLAFGDRPLRLLTYADRQDLRYAFVLRNRGRVGVTVRDLQARASGKYQLLNLHADRLAPAGRADVDADAGRPFAPFALGAGEQRVVVLRGTFADCEHISPRAASMLDEVRVDFAVLGLHRTTTLALPERLRTQSPSDQGCPLSTFETRSPA